MWLLISGLLGLLFTTAAADTSVVWICNNFIYADGYIYRHETSNGVAATDLRSFPANRTFPVNLAITEHSDQTHPFEPVFLARSTDSLSHRYTVLPEQLYLDASPGAFAPIGFVAGGSNATLAPGQTTWGFFGAYGFLLFSPTGNVADIGTPDNVGTGGAGTGGGTQVLAQQGYTWVDKAGYPGVSQLYWNQTQFDEVVRRGNRRLRGATFGMCSGDYEGILTRAGVEE